MRGKVFQKGFTELLHFLFTLLHEHNTVNIGEVCLRLDICAKAEEIPNSAKRTKVKLFEQLDKYIFSIRITLDVL
jgi:hypothetical protein